MTNKSTGKTVTVPISSLMLDLENPRLPPQDNQHDALGAMIDALGDKLVALAEHMVEFGVDPSDLPLVTRDEEDDALFVVLEGNRRLAALRLLGNPTLAKDRISGPAMARLRRASEAFEAAPLTSLSCIEYSDRAGASPWIVLRHRGEQEGKGRVTWGVEESARYDKLLGRASRYLATTEAEDFLLGRGLLDPATSAAIKNRSTIQRVLQDPDIRKVIGVGLENGHLVTDLDDDAEVAKGLVRIFSDAAAGKLSVSDVKTKKDRAAYAERLRKSTASRPSSTAARSSTRKLAKEATAVPAKGAARTVAAKRSKTPTRNRGTVIPKTCKLVISSKTKLNNIYDELRRLKVENFPNAAGVLLRVFFELTVDDYLERTAGLSHADLDKMKLRPKIERVTQHLQDTGTLNKRQVQGLKLAANPQHAVAASLDTLHAYVHSPDLGASADSLKAAWDDLEIFFATHWK